VARDAVVGLLARARSVGSVDRVETSISEAIARLRAEGYGADFRVDGVALRCAACGESHAPADARMEQAVRIEGVTDPADEAIVLGLACVACGARGVLVSAYGHAASAEEAAVMRALLDARG
jgi:hypothetical protein